MNIKGLMILLSVLLLLSSCADSGNTFIDHANTQGQQANRLATQALMTARYQNILLLKAADYQGLEVTRQVFKQNLQGKFVEAVEHARHFPYSNRNKPVFFDFKVHAESKVSAAKRAEYQSNRAFFHLLYSTLPMLAFAYHTPGVEAGDNPYYQNSEISQLYLEVLDYVHSRGIDENTWLPDHAGVASHQGLQAGLHRQSGDLSDRALFLGGFVQSIFLMRETIRAAGELDKYRRLLRNLSINNGVMYAVFFQHARVDAGIKYQGQPPQQPYYLNADGLRLFVEYFLPYYMLIEDQTEYQQMTGILHAVIANNLAIKPGSQDLFKVDGSGFHHHTAYHGGYAPETFASWATMLYLLAGSGSYSEAQLAVLKQALQSHRFMTQHYSVPTALRGRLLSKDGEGSSLAVLKAMALLAHPDAIADKEMQARFKEYFAANYFDRPERLHSFYKGDRGTQIDGLGIFRLVADIQATDTAAAAIPSGTAIKPYAAAGFYRRDNWLAAVKGFSRYFWDYEGPLNKQQNVFGQNVAYGSLQLLSAGQPINSEASGLSLNHGWDWYHLPGTTASHYPIKVRSYQEVQAQRRKQAIVQQSIQRNYSTRSFVGGVNLGDSGIFALDLQAVPFTEATDLQARKSYFFVDGKIVALGTNIDGGTATHATHTTLFQTRIDAKADYSQVNGKQISRLGVKQQISTYKASGYIDAVGNSYYLAATSGVVNYQRQRQQSLDTRYRPTAGNYALLYLDHGIKPRNHHYEYVIIPADKQGRQLTQLMANPDDFYQVVAADGLHILAFPQQKISAYAFYELQDTPPSQLIKSASLHAVVMTKEEDEGITLAVSVPDLGWQVDIPRLQQQGLAYTSKHYAQQKAPQQQLQLTLRGHWQLARHIEGVELSWHQGETRLRIKCSDGLTQQLGLIAGN